MKPIIKNKNAACLIDVVDMCPVNVFEKRDGKVIVANPNDCLGCMACELNCDGIVVK